MNMTTSKQHCLVNCETTIIGNLPSNTSVYSTVFWKKNCKHNLPPHPLHTYHPIQIRDFFMKWHSPHSYTICNWFQHQSFLGWSMCTCKVKHMTKMSVLLNRNILVCYPTLIILKHLDNILMQILRVKLLKQGLYFDLWLYSRWIIVN